MKSTWAMLDREGDGGLHSLLREIDWITGYSQETRKVLLVVLQILLKDICSVERRGEF